MRRSISLEAAVRFAAGITFRSITYPRIPNSRSSRLDKLNICHLLPSSFKAVPAGRTRQHGENSRDSEYAASSIELQPWAITGIEWRYLPFQPHLKVMTNISD